MGHFVPIHNSLAAKQLHCLSVIIDRIRRSPPFWAAILCALSHPPPKATVITGSQFVSLESYYKIKSTILEVVAELLSFFI